MESEQMGKRMYMGIAIEKDYVERYSAEKNSMETNSIDEKNTEKDRAEKSCAETERTNRGTRCRICTGCGRCSGVNTGKVHIVTHSPETETIPFPMQSMERLVTVDIGTTTIAMQLYEKNGTETDYFAAVNPQTAYGADVLSRIQAAGNRADAMRMKQMVEMVLRRGLTGFRKYLKQGERFRMVLAANTTMVYLLQGWNPEELGHAPFHVSHMEPVETQIAGVPCYIFQPLSAFVGGDILAGMQAIHMMEREGITLFIDLGTNGEMALGNKEHILACSTAAGPAFEGGVNKGVWGADMVSLIARLLRENILDETGLLADPYFDEGIMIGDVHITQQSIRAVQLAKAAIAAGIRILISEYGISWDEIARVVLAGGFGYYLNPADAVQIGLLPKELEAKTVAGGNTALAGALCMGRKWMENPNQCPFDVNKRKFPTVSIINLAAAKGFEERYIQSMNLQIV